MKVIKSIIFPTFILNFIKSVFKKGMKITILLLMNLFISLVVTYFVSCLISIPTEMEKKLDFYVDGNNLVSEIYCNCLEEYEVNTDKNCINLMTEIYSVSMEMDIVNYFDGVNVNQSEIGIIETQLEFFNEGKRDSELNIKRIAFLKTDKKLLQMVYDLFLSIPKYFGYLKSERVFLMYTKDYKNFHSNLEKVKLTIFTKEISIESAKILFIPKLSYLKYFIGKAYYISIFGVFLSTFLFLDLFVVFYIMYKTTEKPLKHKKTNEKEAETETEAEKANIEDEDFDDSKPIERKTVNVSSEKRNNLKKKME